MAKTWVCNTCLVTNELTDKCCSCCGSLNSLEGSLRQESPSDLLTHQNAHRTVYTFQNVEKVEPKQEHKVKPDDENIRFRLKYTHSDLKHTSVFIVGSSEIEQIPYSCCDKKHKQGTNELVSMYECSLPTPILSLPKLKISSVSCGALHTVLLTSTGSVYTFGCNDMGALGRAPPSSSKSSSNSNKGAGVSGTTNDLMGTNTGTAPGNVSGTTNEYSWESEPTLLDLKFKVKKVTCGDNHTLLLSYSGSAYFTGGFKDTFGPIGVADYNSYESLRRLDYYTEPVRVPCEGSIVDIASGENHCVLLCQGGNNLYTFGSNEFSQLLLWDNDVYNPTENDVDLTVESNLKLLLTWPQSRKLADILAGAMVSSNAKKSRETAESTAHSGHESYSKTGLPTSYSLNESSAGNVGTTQPDVVAVEKGAKGKRSRQTAESGKNRYEDVSEHATERSTRGTKRSRSNQDLITQIYTGNCTTFFQTKSLRLYGVGRNAQGEVGVGSEDLVVEYPTELEFFRGVEVTDLSGGQFFTMALVNNYVFIWGKQCYLGIPNNYDSSSGDFNTYSAVSSYQNAPEEMKMENMYGTMYSGTMGDQLHYQEYKYAHMKPKTGRYEQSMSYNEKYFNKQNQEHVVSSRRRKTEDDGFEMDDLDKIEKLQNYDYTRSYMEAFRRGKATTPVLLPFRGSVKTVFHGSDSLFALTFEDDLYSWGSSQNYILANGKDEFYQSRPELVPHEYFPTCKVLGGAGGSQHTVILAQKRRMPS